MQSWKSAQFGNSLDYAGVNDPSDTAYCHVLEWSASAPAYDKTASGEVATWNWTRGSPTVSNIIARTLDQTAPGPNSPGGQAQGWASSALVDAGGEDGQISAAFGPSNNEVRDRSIMAWSFCQLRENSDPTKSESWTVNEVLTNSYQDQRTAKTTGGGGNPGPEHCASWWTSS